MMIPLQSVVVRDGDADSSCVGICDVDAPACLRHRYRRCRQAALGCRCREERAAT